MPTEEQLQGGFNLGDWEVLPGHGELRRGDEVKRPEPKQFVVLMALARRGTNLVTKQELIDEVWGGRPTADEPITRCVSQLRGHLDDRQTPHLLIETLQRRGYRLKQSVELHNPPEPEVALATAPKPHPSLRLWKLGAVTLAVGFIAIASYTWIKPLIDPPPARSIAVMPFQNLSGAASDEYLVLGFKEELVQILQNIDTYTVKNGRINYEKEDDAVADLLGVENLLFGTLRRSGDDLKITYRISRGGDVVHGGEIEGSMPDVFALQEALAILVRENLVGKSAQTLIKSRPSDSDAYDSYMRGMFALEHRGDPGNLEKAAELFENAIRLDDSYGPSYLALATVFPLLPNYRGAPPEEMDRLALETINKGIAADPAIEDVAGAIFGYVYHKQKRWEESEAAFLQAINADVVDSNAFNWYSRMLASVGRLDASLAQALAGLEIDPSSTFLNSRVAMSYTWLEKNEEALKYYERANAFGWNGSTHVLSYAFILIQTGQFEKARNLAMGVVQMAEKSTGWIGPVFDAFSNQTQANAISAIEAVNNVSAVEPIDPRVEFTVRTMLGDLDGAMRIAQLLEQPGETFEIELLFIPQLKDFRRHPDFMPLMNRLGITQYWHSRGCVWNSDRVNCPSD
jgi:DNA-binding winged helix-turn-helix (wHTH) protein/TolB-like protein/Tfp pilus assembly protein PilF